MFIHGKSRNLNNSSLTWSQNDIFFTYHVSASGIDTDATRACAWHVKHASRLIGPRTDDRQATSILRGHRRSSRNGRRQQPASVQSQTRRVVQKTMSLTVRTIYRDGIPCATVCSPPRASVTKRQTFNDRDVWARVLCAFPVS